MPIRLLGNRLCILGQLGYHHIKPVTPDPVQIATEGAQWGGIHAHGFLRDAVVLSDDAGQFAVGQHALMLGPC